MLTTTIMGYLLAVAVALSGMLGARMQDSGEIARTYEAHPLPVLAVTIPYGVSGIAALGYFFWVYLDWYQIGTFLVAILVLSSWDTSVQERATTWSLFIGAVVLTVLTELALLSQG